MRRSRVQLPPRAPKKVQVRGPFSSAGAVSPGKCPSQCPSNGTESLRRGTLREKRPEYWELRIRVGRDPLTGHQRQVSRAVRGSRREAEKALAAFYAEVDAPPDPAARGTVGELLDAWLDQVTDRLSPTTVLGLDFDAGAVPQPVLLTSDADLISLGYAHPRWLETARAATDIVTVDVAIETVAHGARVALRAGNALVRNALDGSTGSALLLGALLGAAVSLLARSDDRAAMIQRARQAAAAVSRKMDARAAALQTLATPDWGIVGY